MHATPFTHAMHATPFMHTIRSAHAVRCNLHPTYTPPTPNLHPTYTQPTPTPNLRSSYPPLVIITLHW
jgi:hypothetical protein